MVWPFFPLLLEGWWWPTVATSAVLSICASYGLGWSPFWGLLFIAAVGLALRVVHAVRGPRLKPMGYCSYQDHLARRKAVELEAKKPGPLRMFKATASNTFRPQQIG